MDGLAIITAQAILLAWGFIVMRQHPSRAVWLFFAVIMVGVL